MIRKNKVKAVGVEPLVMCLSRDQWEDCPNCPNQGFTVEERGGINYVTRDMAFDAQEPSMEGIKIDGRYQEQVQCEFCSSNEKSVFFQEELAKK